jgi:hypothetical protein
MLTKRLIFEQFFKRTEHRSRAGKTDYIYTCRCCGVVSWHPKLANHQRNCEVEAALNEIKAAEGTTMSKHAPLTNHDLDELDVLLLQIEDLLDRIQALEEEFVRRGICVSCFKNLKDCDCEVSDV